MKKLLRDHELIRILSGSGLLVIAFLVKWLTNGHRIATPIFFGIALLVVGSGVMWEAIRGILRGQLLDETFLMSIAAIGAFFLGEYAEGVAVMLFYLIGEYCEHRAVRRTRSTIRALMDINPDTARVLREGEEHEVDATEVLVGEQVVLRPGDRVPVDCTVTDGTSAVNTAALTGESRPMDAATGSTLLSGMVILDGVLYATADRTTDTSAAARILELVSEASDRKSRQEKFITAFSRVYTPIVVLLAVLVAFLPPLVLWDAAVLPAWISRALMFLVVSCPCALVISVPLAFFGGIGCAASRGILFKGGNTFDALAHAKTAVFDKTGTLTHGVLSVTEITPIGMEKVEFLRLLSAVEAHSTHPIARAITTYAGQDIPHAEDVREHAGRGLIGTVEGAKIAVGNHALMAEVGAEVPAEHSGIFAARDGCYIGCVSVSDEIKAGTDHVITALKNDCGIRRTVMLTGDDAKTAHIVAEAVGMDECHAALLPTDKYAHLERIIEETEGGTIYVGDGINDAPSLARADVGVAMGGIGSDAAIEAADVVISGDDLSRLPEACGIARRTLGIARFNIFFALGIKIAVMVLATVGLLDFGGGMWIAVFADVGVALLAVLNSLRTLRPLKKAGVA